MIKNGEIAVFGLGPAGISISKSASSLGFGVTAFRPQIDRIPRSVYTTAVEPAQTLKYNPDLVKPLTYLRIITSHGVDFTVKTPGSYFMVDNLKFVDQAEQDLINLGVKIVKLPKKTLKLAEIGELSDGVMVHVDGIRQSYDGVVDCTGVEATIVKKLDPKRFNEDFVAGYVYGGAFKGEMEKDELAIVVGPAGGTSWVCPSVTPGFLDVVYNAWGPASLYKESFLPTAKLRLWNLHQFLKQQPGIKIDSDQAQEIYCGMIRSHPAPPTLLRHVYALGEAAGMARPLTEDSIRFALKGGELLAQALIRDVDAAGFQRQWQRKWRTDLFLALMLTRLPHQSRDDLGKRERFLQSLLENQPDLVKDAQDLFITGKINPKLICSLMTNFDYLFFMAKLVLKRGEVWLKGRDNVNIPWTLPEINKDGMFGYKI